MSSPKKHHYVPECYLKKFKMDGPLYTLDIEKLKKYKKEHVKKVEPGNICYSKDYYLLNSALREGLGEFAVHDLFIEMELLHSLEGKYDAFFKKIVYDRQLSQVETTQFCDFLILLKIRNPYWHLEILEKNKDLWIKEAINAIQQHIEHDIGIPGMKSIYKDLVFKVAKRIFVENPYFTRQIQLRSLLYRYNNIANRNTKYQQSLSTCRWIVLKSPSEGPYFITSDNPGISIGRDRLFYNTRFVDGFIFYFPLSPLYCLAISDNFEKTDWTTQFPKKIGSQNVNEEIVYRINHNASQRINKLLIGGEPSYLQKIADINRPQ